MSTAECSGVIITRVRHIVHANRILRGNVHSYLLPAFHFLPPLIASCVVALTAVSFGGFPTSTGHCNAVADYARRDTSNTSNTSHPTFCIHTSVRCYVLSAFSVSLSLVVSSSVSLMLDVCVVLETSTVACIMVISYLQRDVATNRQSTYQQT